MRFGNNASQAYVRTKHERSNMALGRITCAISMEEGLAI